MKRMRRILFASDLSNASSKAFATAIALAQATDADMTILHVVVPYTPIVPEQYLGGTTLEKLNADAREWAQERVAHLTARAKKGGIRATGLTPMGDPAEQIVRTARAKRADLIVLGTHGRTGLNRFFVGSVAQRVIASAQSPVVTVRSRQ
jgi:nucleotide-binding universal stress UspA family protein